MLVFDSNSLLIDLLTDVNRRGGGASECTSMLTRFSMFPQSHVLRTVAPLASLAENCERRPSNRHSWLQSRLLCCYYSSNNNEELLSNMLLCCFCRSASADSLNGCCVKMWLSSFQMWCGLVCRKNTSVQMEQFLVMETINYCNLLFYSSLYSTVCKLCSVCLCDRTFSLLGLEPPTFGPWLGLNVALEVYLHYLLPMVLIIITF